MNVGEDLKQKKLKFVNTIDYKSYIKHKLQLWRQRKEIAKKKKNQFLKDDGNGKRQKEKY